MAEGGIERLSAAKGSGFPTPNAAAPRAPERSDGRSSHDVEPVARLVC